MRNILPIFLLLTIFAFISCGDDGNGGEGEVVDDFDRKLMLVDMADGIIVPAFENYASKTKTMHDAASAFKADPTIENLQSLRSDWLEAYRAWQYVSIFNIGKAEEISLRNFTNIYPANTDEIEENIISGSYNLELPSKNDEQGFPALDYLLYGLADDDVSIAAQLSEPAYVEYLIALTEKLQNTSNEVVNDWQNGYRESFVENDGSSATSSVNKIVNDYLFYYEKFLRAGKIGIPAGVFSGNAFANKVEAFHSGEYSKELFLLSLDVVQDFFNGTSFQGTSGTGLKAYLDYLNTIKEGEDLSALINQQFDAARVKAGELDKNLALQVETDNSKMLETYDELQKNVVLLKVDMLQAFNIKVDFVDADGD